MKDVWHEVLRDKHESFKWSLLIDTAIETVRMYKQDYLIRRVRSVEKVKFKDLDNAHAWFEGYKHVDLLKHELQCISPDMGNSTVLFQILFEIPTMGLNDLKLRRMINNVIEENIK